MRVALNSCRQFAAFTAALALTTAVFADERENIVVTGVRGSEALAAVIDIISKGRADALAEFLFEEAGPTTVSGPSPTSPALHARLAFATGYGVACFDDCAAVELLAC